MQEDGHELVARIHREAWERYRQQPPPPPRCRDRPAGSTILPAPQGSWPNAPEAAGITTESDPILRTDRKSVV